MTQEITEAREMLTDAFTDRGMDADEARDAADIIADIMSGEVIDELVDASTRTVSVTKMLMDLAYVGEWYCDDIADIIADAFVVSSDSITDLIFEAWCESEYDNEVYEQYREALMNDGKVSIIIAEEA